MQQDVNNAKVAVDSQFKRSATFKQDLDDEFNAKRFVDTKEKIITLSKNSALRKINALAVAKDVRKHLQENLEFTFY